MLSTSEEDATADLHPKNVVERPKVLYHRASQTFVMWIHVDRINYDLAAVGVAVADQPTGPFRYLASFRPGGADSRDFTIFARGDHAWLFHSAESNKTMHVRALASDWRSLADAPHSRLFPNAAREAPAVFYARGRFWMLTSGCSGWDPNAARLAVADAAMGPWTLLGNPCRGGERPELTWGAQSAFVFERLGDPGQHIAMFDRWTKTNLGDSRYVWLPISWLDEVPIIAWESGDRFVVSR